MRISKLIAPIWGPVRNRLSARFGDVFAKLAFNSFLLASVFLIGLLLYFVRQHWVLYLWCLAIAGGFARHVVRYLWSFTKGSSPFKCSNCRHLKLPEELFQDEHDAFPGKKICQTCSATSEPVKVIIMWRDFDPSSLLDTYLPPGAEALREKPRKEY